MSEEERQPMPSHLVALLERTTVEASSPPVTELGKAGQRRRRTIAASTMALVALIGVAAVAIVNQRLSDTDGVTIEAVDNDTTTATSSTSVAPSTGDSNTTEAAEAAETEALETDATPGWSVMVPGNGWELIGLSSTDWFGGQSRATRYLMTDQGDMGPLAVIWYNVDVNTIDYQDGPRKWVDMASPSGRTIRLGIEEEFGGQTAIFRTEVGSAVIKGFDVPQEILLAMTDAVSADGDLFVDQTLIPANYRLVETSAGPVKPHVGSSYQLQRNRTENIEVFASPNTGHEMSYVFQFRYRQDVWDGTINGNRVLIARGDTEGFDTEATVIADDFVYQLRSARWAENSEPMSVEDMRTVVEQLAPISAEELLAQLPRLEDRDAALDRWVTDVGLPDGYDLDWLREGPPLSTSDAFTVYQMVRCAWVLDWAATGDNASLDVLDGHTTWASVREYADLITEQTDNGDEQEKAIVDLTQAFEEELVGARAATTQEQRRSHIAVGSCGWTAELAFGQGGSQD